MKKYLTVGLNELEYKILKNLNVEGECNEKLANILRLYISQLPELRSQDYTLKRNEKKKEIEEILHLIYDEYEDTDEPIEKWDENKVIALLGKLTEINILTSVESPLPSNKFRRLFKMLLHDIATENLEMNEFSAACIATIQLLIEFSAECFTKEDIRDMTILINEEWMFEYSAAMKRAREFNKTKRLYIKEISPISIELEEPATV